MSAARVRLFRFPLILYIIFVFLLKKEEEKEKNNIPR